jgi:hypothetical protein
LTLLKKYPRTFHLPWSEEIAADDKRLKSSDQFEGTDVVVTEKLDGECTSMYLNHIHARSLDSGNHESRDWIKNFWSSFRWQLPKDMRICGENVFAKHSIHYDNLSTYFYGFSVWQNSACLSWEETVEWFALLGIKHVPVLYKGPYDEDLIRTIGHDAMSNPTVEGYVIRPSGWFFEEDFSSCVGKCVRKGHVTTDKHWRNQKVIPNKLRR